MGLRSRDVYPYLPQSPSQKSIIQVGSLFPPKIHASVE